MLQSCATVVVCHKHWTYDNHNTKTRADSFSSQFTDLALLKAIYKQHFETACYRLALMHFLFNK